MSDAQVTDLIFDVKNITLRFGGVVSLRDVSLDDAPRRDLGRHRTERRGQDVALQLSDGRLSAPRRNDLLHLEQGRRRSRSSARRRTASLEPEFRERSKRLVSSAR